jgi:hypothetical protein
VEMSAAPAWQQSPSMAAAERAHFHRRTSVQNPADIGQRRFLGISPRSPLERNLLLRSCAQGECAAAHRILAQFFYNL